jgi:subtilase-type serine protease
MKSKKMTSKKRNPLPIALKVLPALVATTCAASAQSTYETKEYLTQRGLSLINAIEAYDQGFTGKGVTVGVVDSGIVSKHAEFKDSVVGGYDFTLGKPITQQQGIDTDGHGSHVSGIIAANRDGKGMHGVAFNSKLWVTHYNEGQEDDDDDDDDDEPTYEEGIKAFDNSLGEAWHYMAQQKLAIINNSLGVNGCDRGQPSDGSMPCNVADYLPSAKHYFDVQDTLPNIIKTMHELKDAGTLMVFATGNEAQENPDALGGMPVLYPELKPNWIAVTAVYADMDLKNPELTNYANACGIAKEWCVAAPGSNDEDQGIISVSNGKKGGYVDMDGTSMASPHVAGAAALVKEAFPFFNAYQLQQSLLTTATDLTPNDGTRLDPLFGWGLLNAGKAVRGPGLFVSAFEVDTLGYQSTFSNDIGDLSKDAEFFGQKGSLIKSGQGTLTLSGHNTYQGDTTVDGGTLRITGTQDTGAHIVNAGALVVDGTIASSSLTTVNAQGLLSGTGTVGSLDNKGTVAPGNSIGTLTVSGDYTAFKGSTLAIEIDDKNQVDVLRVAGNTTLEAGSKLAVQKDGFFRQGIAYNFLETSGTVVNHGLEVDSSLLFLTPHVFASSSGNGLSLDIRRNGVAFSQYASGQNQRAVANALDPFSSLSSVPMQDIYDELLHAQADAFSSTLDQLSGEAYASVQSALFNQSQLWTTASSRRMNGLFSGSPAAKGPLWVSTQGQWDSLNGRSGSADMRSRTNGLFIGADVGVGANGHVGAAFGYHDGNVRVDDRSSKADTDSYTLAVYGGTRWAMSNGHALNWRASGAWTNNKIDMTRHAWVGADRQRLKASYHSQQTHLYTELGYALPVASSTALEPFGRVAWIQNRNGRFTEDGGSAALHAKRQTNSLNTLTLGLRSYSEFSVSTDRAFRLTSEIGWRHAGGDVKPGSKMQFDQLRDARFTVHGAPISRNSLQVGLNGELDIYKNASLGLDYSGQFGGGNKSNAGSLYVNIKF